jgi:hypothetical protein
MTRHVVQMSSGAGSAYAAKLVIDRHGVDRVTLLFADVRRDGGEWWEGEDPDNYRFLDQAVDHLGAPLVTVKDGRGVWGVAEDEDMIPSNRTPFCSRVLKTEPCRRWVEANCDPDDTTIHVGIDLAEIDRCEGIAARWAPWHVEFPLLWKPMAMKSDAITYWRSVGIDPPRMYAEGFQHANCAGACVRMGNGAAEHLLRARPEVFAGMEAREEAIRARLGKDVAFLVDRRGLAEGEPRRPFPLAALRAEIEARDAMAPRLFDDMGCGRCF